MPAPEAQSAALATEPAAAEAAPTPGTIETPPRPPESGLLASPRGRVAAFFLLYVVEGIPLGFTATALAAQMRRQGLGPEAIGLFVASLYLPWSWKWLMGPLVDLAPGRRFGGRRAWIAGCQVGMAATLLAAAAIDFKTSLGWFTAVVFLHNAFAATMDVAIDAVACRTLLPDERGRASGWMFAGAYLGNAVGGAGVLFLLPYLPLQAAFLLVAGMILLVTATVSWRVRETFPGAAAGAAAGDAAPTNGGPSTPPAPAAVRDYLQRALSALFGSKAAWAATLFVVLPTGAYALGLALQSNLAVELGMSDPQIGALSFASAATSAIGCICGGWLSDRFGRRRMLALYIFLASLPTLALAGALQSAGRIMPAPGGGAPAGEGLLAAFWGASLVFSLFHGLMYGARTALVMDLCDPRIAATQFTLSMSLMNFSIATAAWWQGVSAARVGYPSTLLLDVAFGFVCLLPLAFAAPNAPSTAGRG